MDGHDLDRGSRGSAVRGPRSVLRAARRGLARASFAAHRSARPLRRAWHRVRARGHDAGQVHLAWTDDPRTSLTVVWHATTRCQVEIEDAAGRRSVVGAPLAPTGGAGTLWRADLTGLEPGSEIAYRVVSDRGATPTDGGTFLTRTAPADPNGSFRAAFLCDVGIAGRTDGSTAAQPSVLAEIAADAPLLVLGGGDYAYADRDARFRDPADAIDEWFAQTQRVFARAPFLAQYGNHDVGLGERYEDWSPRLPHPPGSPSGRSFSFDVGAAHFVGLFAPGERPPEDELRWLERDLTRPAGRRAAWRIVFQHASLFAHGSSHPARPEVRDLRGRFEGLGVDLHLSGHDQSFERTHSLRGEHIHLPSGDDACPCYVAGDGTLYAKVSPAGKRSDRASGFSRLTEAFPAEIAARDDSHHHWAVLDVSAVRLEMRTFGVAEPGAPRQPIDRFALVRHDDV